MLKTSQVAKLFKVSPMTIGRWVETFSAYLSHTAQSTSGTERRFSESDLETISLIADMRGQGNEFDLIAATLGTGRRGILPQVDTLSIVKSPANTELALSKQIAELRDELHSSNGQVELLKEQLADTQYRLERLIAENAVLKSKIGQG